ncbi:MAG TPA: hypothetical protein VKE70_24745, partial [Candidatus Solibacter sp.]|nr:hypothetical protein [Candidatus Solibacter sp.]
LATGHAGVVVKLNLVAALLALPGYYLAIETWGSVGAAMVWFGYNAVLFFIWPYLLHRTVLKTELWRWYKTDVLPPLLGAAGAGLAVKAIAGRVVLSGMAADAVFLAAAVLASGAVAVVLTPKPRTRTVGALSVILRRLR